MIVPVLVIVGVGVVAAWVVIALLALRLPPGVAREALLFVPNAVVTVRRLLRDPRVPKRVKVALVLAGLWALSPIDLIPEFIPVIGALDDLVVVAYALRLAARRVPAASLREAWPGEPALLERMIRPRRPS